MATLEKIREELKSLSPEDLDSLMKEMRQIKKEVRAHERAEQAGKWRNDVRIGEWVKYSKLRETNIGRIVIIKESGVQVVAEGKERKISVNWIDIDGVYPKKEDAQKALSGR